MSGSIEHPGDGGKPADLSTPDDASDSVPVPLHIAFVEISNFRRLRAVRLELDRRTTLLVGANNSGKTAAIAALRFFLDKQTHFSAYDISAAGWSALTQISKAWDCLPLDLAAKPTSGEEDSRATTWEQELQTLQDVMPSLDLWLRAEAGDFHRVSHLIPTLSWNGGLVGVRLRLQPASTVEELRQLAVAYRKARSLIIDGKVGAAAASDTAWPMDLLDYWKRHPRALGKVAAYKLDPEKVLDVDDVGRAKPQALQQVASPFQSDPLEDLLCVHFLPAQRGLGSEEAEARGDRDDHRPGLFSQQLVKFTRSFFDSGSLKTQQQRDLLLTLAKSQADLDGALNEVLKTPLGKVQRLGYPSLNDPRDMVFRSRVRPTELLNHSTAVQYRLAEEQGHSQHLPEHAIGLGYQNLLSLSFSLLSFENDRVQPPVSATSGVAPAPKPVHLVLLEEPEAHLHVQVHHTFVHKAYDLVKPSLAGLSSQLVLSTHSSHMAYALPFQNLRFFRRVAPHDPSALPTSVVLGLSDAFGEDRETRRFVERYLRLQHSDLLFADAAIFIEGTAERMLIPSFVERTWPALTERYLSYLELGGSHAHRWRPLLERLGLTCLIITDLDPLTVTPAAAPSGKPTKEKAPVDLAADQITANPTLAGWLPAKSRISEVLAASDADKERALGVWTDAMVRVAYQVAADGSNACATSFEDALLLENRGWFKALPADSTGALGAMRRLAARDIDDAELARAAHQMLAAGFDKGAFALDLLFSQPATTEAGKAPIQCPRYVREGLDWLVEQLTLSGEGADA